MNAIVAKQLRWRSAMKKTLKLNRFLAEVSVSKHKIYVTAIFMHLVLELCSASNKNLRFWFKATLTLEARIGYICNTQGYQRICDGLKMKLT